MIKNCGNLRMAATAYNTVITPRAIRPLVCKMLFEEAESADNPARLSGGATRS